MTRPMQWETVPGGTDPSSCRGQGCGKVIFWVERPRKGTPKKGQSATVRVPVDCSVHGGKEPSPNVDGKGVNHFQTCPAANRF